MSIIFTPFAAHSALTFGDDAARVATGYGDNSLHK